MLGGTYDASVVNAITPVCDMQGLLRTESPRQNNNSPGAVAHNSKVSEGDLIIDSFGVAGLSAHNQKVVGSEPTPATEGTKRGANMPPSFYFYLRLLSNSIALFANIFQDILAGDATGINGKC